MTKEIWVSKKGIRYSLWSFISHQHSTSFPVLSSRVSGWIVHLVTVQFKAADSTVNDSTVDVSTVDYSTRYIPAHVPGRIPNSQGKQYSTITEYMRQNGTVRQMNYPLLAKFMWGKSYSSAAWGQYSSCSKIDNCTVDDSTVDDSAVQLMTVQYSWWQYTVQLITVQLMIVQLMTVQYSWLQYIWLQYSWWNYSWWQFINSTDSALTAVQLMTVQLITVQLMTVQFYFPLWYLSMVTALLYPPSMISLW